MADEVTAALDGIRERRALTDAPCGLASTYIDRLHASTRDVPRLLAVADEVLKLHEEHEGCCTRCREVCDCFEPWNLIAYDESDWGKAAMNCQHGNETWPCPTVRTITAALLGKEGESGG